MQHSEYTLANRGMDARAGQMQCLHGVRGVAPSMSPVYVGIVDFLGPDDMDMNLFSSLLSLLVADE